MDSLKQKIDKMSEEEVRKALLTLTKACNCEFDFEEQVANVLDIYDLRPEEEEDDDEDDAAETSK